MKKLLVLLCCFIAVLSLCACNNTAEFDYSDEANDELISYESRKVSGDDIGMTVVSLEQSGTNKVKVYKTEYTAEDFSIEIKDKKLSAAAYISEEEQTARYPKKVSLPQYDEEMLEDIVVSAYAEKYGALPEDAVITAPQFSTKNFTGKLIISYTVYSEQSVDAMDAVCYAKAQRVTMTGDLYTYEVE